MGLLQGPKKEFLGIAIPRTVKCNQKKPPPFGCISKEPGKSGRKGLPISGGLDYNNELIQKFCREAQVFAALGLYYSGREKVCKPQWQTIESMITLYPGNGRIWWGLAECPCPPWQKCSTEKA